MVGFVILHYNELQTTINCVESILKLSDDVYVVIVDNGSPDGSGSLLTENYAYNPNVKVIQTHENLGFAKGNNIGYRYLKDNFSCDYICISNNDILINQRNFCSKLDEIYSITNFDLCGPMILNKNGFVNPVRYNKPSVSRAIKDLIEIGMYYVFSILNLDNLALRAINFIKGAMGKNTSIPNTENINTPIQYDVVLHGCFWIFSKKFVDRFDGLNPNTFLYHEEELLYIEAKKKDAKIIYAPNIRVIHLEDISTNSIVKSKLQKRRFKYKNEIKSLKVLIRELNRNE